MIFCNVNISCRSLQEILTFSSSFTQVVTVNAEAIVRTHKDSRLLAIINESLATIDGQIPLWLYNLKYPMQKAEKLSGSDLIYDICEWSGRKGYKVFLLGGNSDANREAALRLNEKYNIEIEGFAPDYAPYPFDKNLNKLILQKISRFSPDILFVAFGMGKQEFWIADNKEDLMNTNVKMAIGCGGTFDFVAGKLKRAPIYVQKIGLEGIWRLIMEPKLFRLKRVLLSFKIFKYALLDYLK